MLQRQKAAPWLAVISHVQNSDASSSAKDERHIACQKRDGNHDQYGNDPYPKLGYAFALHAQEQCHAKHKLGEKSSKAKLR
jgi:hypothetical protein